MNNEKVFVLIAKFAELTGEKPENKYQAQREMLAEFFDKFYTELRSVVNELGGDILVLRGQNFDPQMQQLLRKVHHDLMNLIKEIHAEKPYMAAQKLVQYVLDKPNNHIIDNLDFLAKHHVKVMSADLPEDKVFKHAEINSLDKLKTLAIETKKFMQEHPLIQPVEKIDLPKIHESFKDIPSFTSGKDDLTRH